MATPLDYTWDLPYPPEAMFSQGVQRDYVEALAKTLSHYDLQLLTLEDGPGGGRAVATYEVETDLPSWAKKMFPARSKITESRTWGPAEADGTRSYLFTVKIDQVPVEIKGKVSLIAKGDGTTTNTVHIDVKAGIPIVGKKLEELVAKDLTKNVEGERDFITSWMRTRA
jgi:Protein of unknown function (DUF2505)